MATMAGTHSDKQGGQTLMACDPAPSRSKTQWVIARWTSVIHCRHQESSCLYHLEPAQLWLALGSGHPGSLVRSGLNMVQNTLRPRSPCPSPHFNNSLSVGAFLTHPISTFLPNPPPPPRTWIRRQSAWPAQPPCLSVPSLFLPPAPFACQDCIR